MNLVVKQPRSRPRSARTCSRCATPPAGDGLDNAVFLQVLPARRDAKKGEKGAGRRRGRGRARRVRLRLRRRRARGRDGARARPRRASARRSPTRSPSSSATSSRSPRRSSPTPDGGEHSPPSTRSTRATREDTLGVAGAPGPRPVEEPRSSPGREVVPGLGVEGEFYAGIQAAAHVAAAARAKGRPQVAERRVGLAFSGRVA